MSKPKRLKISELVKKTNCSRVALFKKCSRATLKKESLIYVSGSGWYSITKPSKEYILYLIVADPVSEDTVKREVESNVKDLIDIVDNLVCSECQNVIKDIKKKLIK